MIFGKFELRFIRKKKRKAINKYTHNSNFQLIIILFVNKMGSQLNRDESTDL